MRTFGTDRQTDGQTDGGGFIRTPEGVLTSKLEVDPPGDLKRRKVPVLESISGGTHLRVIQTN